MTALPAAAFAHASKEQLMLDVIFVTGGVGFFILSIAYAYACDRL